MSIYFMKRHIPKMLKSFYEKGKLEVGIDEAGRGPLIRSEFTYWRSDSYLKTTQFDHSV